MKNRHEGEAVAVLATGPSIGKTDLALLEGITTIGVNLIVEKFDPDYLVWVDSWVRDDHIDLINRSRAKRVCHSRAALPVKCIRFETYNPGPFDPVISDELDEGLYIGKTVTCAAINLAFIMGARAIIICGLDLCDWGHFYDGRLDTRHSNPAAEFPNRIQIHEDLGRISEYAKMKRVPVINANLESAVRCFRKLTLPMALEMLGR